MINIFIPIITIVDVVVAASAAVVVVAIINRFSNNYSSVYARKW